MLSSQPYGTERGLGQGGSGVRVSDPEDELGFGAPNPNAGDNSDRPAKLLRSSTLQQHPNAVNRSGGEKGEHQLEEEVGSDVVLGNSG